MVTSDVHKAGYYILTFLRAICKNHCEKQSVFVYFSRADRGFAGENLIFVRTDGLFFAHGDGFQTGFFDIEGNLIIDLSSADMTGIPYCEEFGVNAPYFENGEATILFKNNGDTVYRATIDKTGEYIGEPQKTDIKVQ